MDKPRGKGGPIQLGWIERAANYAVIHGGGASSNDYGKHIKTTTLGTSDIVHTTRKVANSRHLQAQPS